MCCSPGLGKGGTRSLWPSGQWEIWPHSPKAAHSLRAVKGRTELTKEELEAVVGGLSSGFGWDLTWNELTVERVWMTPRAGNRFALMNARDGADQIVIKHLGARTGGQAGLDPARPSTLAARMDDLADLLEKRCPLEAHSPKSLGWLEEPPVVAAIFIEGTELAKVLRQPDHPSWESPGVIRSWMKSAGAALAVFHDYGPTGSRSEADAIADLARTLSRYGLSRGRKASLLDYATDPGVLVPRFRDFASSNLLGQPDGRVVVLDPPVDLELAARHRDIANFLFNVQRNLAGFNPAARHAPDPARGKPVRHDFLAGYESQSGFEVEAGRGGALLAMYESVLALAMARRIAAGHPGYKPGFRLRWDAVRWGTKVGLANRAKVIRELRNNS